MKAIVYSRVSTDAQERDGTSLETQERACLARAEELGWQVVRTIRDHVSGAVLERDGLTELRDALRRGEANVVVAYAVDRLSRNQNHIGILFDEFQRAEARLELVTERFEDTAVGRFVLAARAFVAEVEREKIVERTMRGKAERARSGRLPQGTGAGCYGYTYNALTGRREVEPFQAGVVTRIFTRYAETRSFTAVVRELNEAGIPALSGGRWYPLTIRRLLLNDSYIGRTVYRRTKRVTQRSRSGAKVSRVVAQPESEHIEIEGATPPIIPAALWSRVQQILADPERTLRRETTRRYELRGRLRCGLCHSAMVGQTLSPKGKPYTYYRCRHAYVAGSGRDCLGKYVSGPRLEAGVWGEITQVLTHPELIIDEWKRRQGRVADPEQSSMLRARLKSLEKREERLVRLYGFGEVDESAIRPALAEVRRERDATNAELAALEPKALGEVLDESAVRAVCAAIAERLEHADEAHRDLTLEALQIEVTATNEEAIVEGVIPIDAPDFLITNRCLSPLNEHGHDDVHEAVVADGAEHTGG